jgi:hypothetical protein
MVIRNKPPGGGLPKPVKTDRSSRGGGAAKTRPSTKAQGPQSATLSTSAFTDSVEKTDQNTHGNSGDGPSNDDDLGKAAKTAVGKGGELRRGKGPARKGAQNQVMDGGGHIPKGGAQVAESKTSTVKTADAIKEDRADDALMGLAGDDGAPAAKTTKTAKAVAGKAARVAVAKGATAAVPGAVAQTQAGVVAKAASGDKKAVGKTDKAGDGGADATGDIGGATKVTGKGAGATVAGAKGDIPKAAGKGEKAAVAGGDDDPDGVVMKAAKEKAGAQTGQKAGAQVAQNLNPAAKGSGVAGPKSTSQTRDTKSSSSSKESGGAGAASGGKGAKSAGPALKGGGGEAIGDTKGMRELEGQLVSDRPSEGSGGVDDGAQLDSSGAEQRTAGEVKSDMAPTEASAGLKGQLKAETFTQTAELKGAKLDDGKFSSDAAKLPKADLVDVARDVPDNTVLDKDLRDASSAQRESDIQDHLHAETSDMQQVRRGGSNQVNELDSVASLAAGEGAHLDGVLLDNKERAKAAAKGAPFMAGGDRRGIDFPVITADMKQMAAILSGLGLDISDIVGGLELKGTDGDEGEGEGEEEVDEDEDE